MLPFRFAMATVGVGLFALYALGAVGLYLLLSRLLREAALGATVAVLVAVTVVGAYLNYRAGPARLVAGLDARQLPRARAPDLYRRLDRVAAAMGLSTPPVLVADLGTPNALSVGGPRSGVVVLDRRLLSLLTVVELEAILAHELAHMAGYDTFVQTMAVSTARALSAVASVLLLPVAVLAHGVDRGVAWASGRPDRPGSVGAWLRLGAWVLVGVVLSAFALAVLAYSRRREYAADRRAAAATGDPAALARALVKISRATDAGGIRSLLYVQGRRDDPDRWLSTHPPVGERVDRLLTGPDGR